MLARPCTKLCGVDEEVRYRLKSRQTTRGTLYWIYDSASKKLLVGGMTRGLARWKVKRLNRKSESLEPKE